LITLNDITDALVGQIEHVFSTVTDITVHVEGDLFAVAETPYITIFPTASNGLDRSSGAFGELYGGIPLTIGVRTGSAASVEANRLLKDFMDDEHPLSIVNALDYDRTLGGIATTIGWGDGWPWSGFSSFPSANADGEIVGSNMAIVVHKAYS